jgi:hypothetical protein
MPPLSSTHTGQKESGCLIIPFGNYLHAPLCCAASQSQAGEVAPDSGDALVGGLSLLRQPAAARQLLGYCPQASALPAQMTGREVVRLYSRLRWVNRIQTNSSLWHDTAQFNTCPRHSAVSNCFFPPQHPASPSC